MYKITFLNSDSLPFNSVQMYCADCMPYINTILFGLGRFMGLPNPNPSSEFGQHNFWPLWEQFSHNLGGKIESGCLYEHVDGCIVFLVQFYARIGYIYLLKFWKHWKWMDLYQFSKIFSIFTKLKSGDYGISESESAVEINNVGDFHQL